MRFRRSATRGFGPVGVSHEEGDGLAEQVQEQDLVLDQVASWKESLTQQMGVLSEVRG